MIGSDDLYGVWLNLTIFWVWKPLWKNHYSRKLVPLICNDNVPLSNSAFIFLGKFSFSELTLKNRKVESTKIEKGWRKPKTLKVDWGNLFLIFLWKKFIWNHKYRKLLFNLFKRFTLRYSEHHLGRVFNINGNHSMQTRKNNWVEVSYEEQAKSCTVFLGGLFKDCKYLQECLLVDEKVSVLNFIHT